MREHFFSALAFFLAKPCVFNWLVRFGSRKPYVHLGDYMNRYWLIRERPWVPFSVRLHHIKKPDADDVLHDHPFNWRTLIVKGWYVEESVFGEVTTRKLGDTRAAVAETFHRINQVSEGGAWTVFIMSRRRNPWGFLVGWPPRKIHWQRYVSPNERTGEKPNGI